MLQRDTGGDAGPPVAALGDEPPISESAHQFRPRIRDAMDVPTCLGRRAAEPVSGQRGDDNMEAATGVIPNRAGSESRSMLCSNSKKDPGQPCVMISGVASGMGERRWKKWMGSPSIAVVNCGSRLSRRSVATQSYDVSQ